jgi:sugar transferase (PEP-CTERM/EpsH1 system associated)
MNILFITHHIPYPPIAGARLRNFHLLKRLGKEHDIWLVVLSHDEHTNPQHVDSLKKFCREVKIFYEPDQGALERPLEGVKYLLSGMPPDLRFIQSREMSNFIQQITKEIDFDAVEIVFSYMARFIEDLPPELHRKTVLTFIDVLFSKYDRIYRIESRFQRKIREWLNSRMMRLWEPRYAERFGCCAMMSKTEMELLHSVNPRIRMDVVPNGVDTKMNRPLNANGSKPSLVFVGNMEYAANVDAMSYFMMEILPLIRKDIPETEMWMVGVNPRDVIKAMEGNGVHVTGRVEDVRPYYQRSQVCVIPLRAGGGTRLKILESMALGRPVVSTSIGYEGIEAIEDEQILVADKPEEFAKKTVLLLRDENYRKRLVKSARELVVAKYDWDSIASKLASIYSSL